MNEEHSLHDDRMMVLNEGAKSIIKGCFGAIPTVGAALDEIAFEFRGRVYQNRLNRFIELLAEYMSSVRAGDIDFRRLTSDEFGDIFELITRCCRRIRGKIQRYKRILVQEMMKTANPSDFKETYLDIVSRINEKQIHILSEYRKAHIGRITQDEAIVERGVIDGGNADNTPSKLSPHRYAEYYDLLESKYLFYVQDLVSKSLLVDDGMGRFGGFRPYELLEITPFGVEFLCYIENYN